jgi:hypothetical protein
MTLLYTNDKEEDLVNMLAAEVSNSISTFSDVNRRIVSVCRSTSEPTTAPR